MLSAKDVDRLAGYNQESNLLQIFPSLLSKVGGHLTCDLCRHVFCRGGGGIIFVVATFSESVGRTCHR